MRNYNEPVFYVHPENPQARLINQAVAIIRNGGVVVLPDRFRSMHLVANWRTNKR